MYKTLGPILKDHLDLSIPSCFLEFLIFITVRSHTVSWVDTDRPKLTKSTHHETLRKIIPCVSLKSGTRN